MNNFIQFNASKVKKYFYIKIFLIDSYKFFKNFNKIYNFIINVYKLFIFKYN